MTHSLRIVGAVLLYWCHNTALARTDIDKTQDRLYVEVESLAEVVASIHDYHSEGIDISKISEGAIRGMLQKLDAYSTYMTPTEYTRYRKRRGDVGIRLARDENDGLKISYRYPQSDSGNRLLKINDILLSIDGSPVEGWSLERAHLRLSGETGTRILTRWRRKDQNFELELLRQYLVGEAISWRELEGGGLWVRLRHFSKGIGKALREKLEQKAPKFLVLDLRANPGGRLEEAVRVAELFLKKGDIVKIVNRKNRIIQNELAHERPYFSMPLVVWVDHGSASAAEVVAAALKANGRAELVGERTYGKGSIQTITPLSNGGALKLTVAHFITPLGRVDSSGGLQPDHACSTQDIQKLARCSRLGSIRLEEAFEGISQR